MIFIGGEPCGIIEAKAYNKGESLFSFSEQTARYAESQLKFATYFVDIRFAHEATDVLTHFCDYHDIDYRSREVFSFHRPEQLQELLFAEDTIRNRMKQFPKLDTNNLRACQI